MHWRTWLALAVLIFVAIFVAGETWLRHACPPPYNDWVAYCRQQYEWKLVIPLIGVPLLVAAWPWRRVLAPGKLDHPAKRVALLAALLLFLAAALLWQDRYRWFEANTRTWVALGLGVLALGCAFYSRLTLAPLRLVARWVSSGSLR